MGSESYNINGSGNLDRPPHSLPVCERGNEYSLSSRDTVSHNSILVIGDC